MKRMLAGLAVIAMFVAGFFALTGSAVAQDDRLDPDIQDFTAPDGESDVTGYLTASSLVADAPLLVQGQGVVAGLEGCDDDTVYILANPATELGSGCDAELTVPDDYPIGFAELIAQDGSGNVTGVTAVYVDSSSTDVENESLDIDPDGAVLQVLQSADDLAETGRETLAFLGFGAAALMLGVTLLDGARRFKFSRS